MPKELERDLGLYATLTISIGAMIGSGIFVLPGLAAKIAGPAVILAYFLAGLLVLPAALSKAEMATAMPESGGTYLYIDRAMGPLPGTIAGLGAWFSLVFKSAFALVGLGAYLLLFVPFPGAVSVPVLGVVDITVAVALALAVLLVAVNVGGVKQTGRLQAAIVTLVLLALVGFIADGITFVDRAMYHPFFEAGGGGLLAATGFVFVSYAGVTKIASVAEEVEDPGRNIPIAMVLSVVVMMLVYTFVVFVVVGVTPTKELTRSLTPMATAAAAFLGETGAFAVAAVAVLALTSMANAGVLSSSRFPFAMSRDALAPDSLAAVHDRFKTPVNAILFTGLVLVTLIAFVPVADLAKLASAFKILIFALVNVALIAFRESDLESYDPEFVAPGYPWVQLFGIVGGIVLLTQMGALPLLGAVGIVAGGVVWYRVYGRARADREGAALDAIRRSTVSFSLDRIRREGIDGGRGRSALIAVRPETTLEDERTLVSVANDVVGPTGRLTLGHFEAVPDQATLSSVADENREESSRESALLADTLGVDVTVTDIVSHDIEGSVVNYADSQGIDLVVGAWEPDRFQGELLGHDIDWYMRHSGQDLLFVRDRGYEPIDSVAVIAERGVYDPLSVRAGNAIAARRDATIRFLYPLDPDASGEHVESTEDYLEELVGMCRASASYRLITTGTPDKDLQAAAAETDLAVVTTSAHSTLYEAVFETLPHRLATELPCTVVLAHSDRSRTHTFLRYVLERLVF